MADLSGQTIASSYEQLLSLPDGGGNANTLVAVTDGDAGTTFGIKLATNKVEIIPGSNDANAFEVSQADGTAVFTVNTSTAASTFSGAVSTGGNFTVEYNDPTSINAGEIAGDNDVLGINIKNTNTSDGTGGMLKFMSDNGDALTAIAHNQSANTSGEMLFFTENSGTFAERMRIDSSGDVGIANALGESTLSAYTHLFIGGTGSVISNATEADGNQIYIGNNVYIDSSTGAFQRQRNDEATLYKSINGTHVFQVAGAATPDADITFTDALTIDNSGNVGIGVTPEDWDTANAFAVLQLGLGACVGGYGTSTPHAILGNNIYFDDTNNRWQYIVNDTATLYHQNNDGKHVWFTADSGSADAEVTLNERMVILNGGNVGIGESDPSAAKLQIDSVQSGDIGLQITQAQAEPGLFIDQNGNNSALKIETTGSTSRAILVKSNQGSSQETPLVQFETENSGFDQNVLMIVQNGPKDALFIDMNANDNAISVDSSATTAKGISINMDSITTGRMGSFTSNSSTTNARNLVVIVNDHTSATGTECLNVQQDANARTVQVNSTSTGLGNDLLLLLASGMSSNSGFDFLVTKTGVDGDFQHALRGDGDLDADGAYSSGGADYAEYFESKDSSAIAVGKTVKLDGEKIVVCEDGDIPLGVIRPKSSSATVGNTATFRWNEKYLKDDYGSYIMEEFTLTEWVDGKNEDGGDNDISYHTDKIPSNIAVPSDAKIITTNDNGEKLMRRKLNPDWDESKTYVPRENRDEWNIVGLLGQVQITKGQPVASNWIKMKDISDTVELWFIK